MTTTAERAKEVAEGIATRLVAQGWVATVYPMIVKDWQNAIASAIAQAENKAEQRAIDRCRQIISAAIAGDNADAESMRRLLLAAFDPRWDRVASIINPKD